MYWERVWIVQEVVLAQRIILICNEYFLDVEILLQIIGVYKADIIKLLKNDCGFPECEFGKCTPSYVRNASNWCAKLLGDLFFFKDFPSISIRTLKMEAEMRTAGSLMPPPHTLARRLKASDPRDYVYGILALYGPEVEVEFDYNKPASQVYLEFFSSAISYSFQFAAPCGHGMDWSLYDNLLAAGAREATGSSNNIPSWIPDLRNLNTSILTSTTCQRNMI